MLLAIEQGNTNTLFAVHDGADDGSGRPGRGAARP